MGLEPMRTVQARHSDVGVLGALADATEVNEIPQGQNEGLEGKGEGSDPQGLPSQERDSAGVSVKETARGGRRSCWKERQQHQELRARGGLWERLLAGKTKVHDSYSWGVSTVASPTKRAE